MIRIWEPLLASAQASDQPAGLLRPLWQRSLPQQKKPTSGLSWQARSEHVEYYSFETWQFPCHSKLNDLIRARMRNVDGILNLTTPVQGLRSCDWPTSFR